MKSQEFINEGTSAETKFRDMFAKAKLPVSRVDIETHDDDWISISAKAKKPFRAGTQEKIQFTVSGVWDIEGDEFSGTVLSQRNSTDKQYSQILDMEDDQHTFEEFVNKVNEFVSDIAKNERDRYINGERDYWAKGGTGMMPGSVKKDYKS